MRLLAAESWGHVFPPAPSLPPLPPAGRMDAKKRLGDSVQDLMSSNIVQCMGAMLDTVVF
jgi:hypothetical protein